MARDGGWPKSFKEGKNIEERKEVRTTGKGRKGKGGKDSDERT